MVQQNLQVQDSVSNVGAIYGYSISILKDMIIIKSLLSLFLMYILFLGGGGLTASSLD